MRKAKNWQSALSAIPIDTRFLTCYDWAIKRIWSRQSLNRFATLVSNVASNNSTESTLITTKPLLHHLLWTPLKRGVFKTGSLAVIEFETKTMPLKLVHKWLNHAFKGFLSAYFRGFVLLFFEKAILVVVTVLFNWLAFLPKWCIALSQDLSEISK